MAYRKVEFITRHVLLMDASWTQHEPGLSDFRACAETTLRSSSSRADSS